MQCSADAGRVGEKHIENDQLDVLAPSLESEYGYL